MAIVYRPLSDPDDSHDSGEDIEIFNSPRNSASETTEKDTVDSDSDTEPPDLMSRKQTWKNICILAMVFIFLFMSYNGLVDLQSSLFVDEGLGVVTQAVVYTTFSLSCLFVPKVVISKLGHKWTVTISMTGYISWMIANGYATWFTMTVTSAMVGLCAAPLWTAQTTYVTQLAENYAKLTNKAVEPTIALFFGVFNAIFQTAALCSNVISWLILRREQDNMTMEVTEEDLQMCGSKDCAASNITNVHFKRVPAPILWSLVAVYVAIGVMGLVFSACFLDDLRSSNGKKKTGRSVSVKEAFMAILKHHKNIRLLLIIPISVCGSMEAVFIWADFNKSYVTCALGVWMVGLVFLPNVVMNCIASLSVGKLATYIPRWVFMTTAFLVQTVVLCFLLFWGPNPDEMYIFYLVPGLMGMASGIIHVTVTSMIAVLFTDLETAFSSVRVWGALGAATAFAINKFLCVRDKIYINCAGLVFWFVCYIILERVVLRRPYKGNPLIKSVN